MRHEIVVGELAIEELQALRPFDQRRVLMEIREQLTDRPTTPTRRRKCLLDLTPSFEHELPVWELRVGDFRVFYDVSQEQRRVHIRAVRRKQAWRRTEDILMSSIPDEELRSNLDSILSLAQTERIVISRHGKPCAVLVGIEDYDVEDAGLANSVDFWRMIRDRRTAAASVSLDEVEERLGIMRPKTVDEGDPAKKPGNQS